MQNYRPRQLLGFHRTVKGIDKKELLCCRFPRKKKPADCSRRLRIASRASGMLGGKRLGRGPQTGNARRTVSFFSDSMTGNPSISISSPA
jgi:hypothetical protein